MDTGKTSAVASLRKARSRAHLADVDGERFLMEICVAFATKSTCLVWLDAGNQQWRPSLAKHLRVSAYDWPRFIQLSTSSSIKQRSRDNTYQLWHLTNLEGFCNRKATVHWSLKMNHLKADRREHMAIRLIDWLIDWLIDLLTDWQTDWLTDWLNFLKFDILQPHIQALNRITYR